MAHAPQPTDLAFVAVAVGPLCAPHVELGLAVHERRVTSPDHHRHHPHRPHCGVYGGIDPGPAQATLKTMLWTRTCSLPKPLPSPWTAQPPTCRNESGGKRKTWRWPSRSPSPSLPQHNTQHPGRRPSPSQRQPQRQRQQCQQRLSRQRLRRQRLRRLQCRRDRQHQHSSDRLPSQRHLAICLTTTLPDAQETSRQTGLWGLGLMEPSTTE